MEAAPFGIRQGQEELHHLIQRGQGNANARGLGGRRRQGWRSCRREPPLVNAVAKARLSGIFDEAIDVGRRGCSPQNGDTPTIEGVSWQHHKAFRLGACALRA